MMKALLVILLCTVAAVGGEVRVCVLAARRALEPGLVPVLWQLQLGLSLLLCTCLSQTVQ